MRLTGDENASYCELILCVFNKYLSVNPDTVVRVLGINLRQDRRYFSSSVSTIQ